MNTLISESVITIIVLSTIMKKLNFDMLQINAVLNDENVVQFGF